MAIDMIDVLCCKITIGDADSGNPMVIKDPIVLTEVEEVEIVETYKKLIGTAKITFPKRHSLPKYGYRELPLSKAKMPAG